MDTGKIKIRNMMVEDVEMGMKAFEEEYDHFDASATVRVYLKTYPSAFFVAVLIETKGTVNSEKIVGLIGAPILCNTAFIGLYGVLPKYRGMGIGVLLFQKCLEFAGNRNISLYAVSDMRQKYIDRYHFIGSGISMVSFSGAVNRLAFDKPTLDSKIKITTIEKKQQVFKDLIRFDNEIFNWPNNFNREKLFENALKEPNYYSKIALLESTNQVLGFGCVRKNENLENTFNCGPILGKTPETCQKILESFIDELIPSDQGQTHLIFNAIDANEQSLVLAREFLGLSFTGKCEILHKNPVSEPQYQYQYIYSVFSLDFGL
ncbi:hypothetical protein TYRP_000305 [Tyrophagus putrescentiae]|nr:hypothetical protein TYRP_000305 [Tyrophagus putrescentiae]